MEEILSLTHKERARWVQQVNRMNSRTKQQADKTRTG
jgi:hypothetical protein